MQDIIDGFLKFRRDAFPQRSALYKQLATSQRPRTLFVSVLRQPARAGAGNSSRNRASCS